jgi:ABC-type multidrug transport system fused ATPase/permease subunit
MSAAALLSHGGCNGNNGGWKKAAQGLRDVWPFWRLEARRFSLATALIIANKCLLLAIPRVGRSIMMCDGEHTLDLLWHLALACLTVVAYHVTCFYGRYVAYAAGNAMRGPIIDAGLRAVMVIDYSRAVSIPPGESAAVTMQSAAALAHASAGVITDLLGAVASAVCIGVAVCLISIPLTVGFIVVAAVTQVLSQRMKTPFTSTRDSVLRADGVVQSTLLASLQRASLVRMFPAAQTILSERVRKDALPMEAARNELDRVKHSTAESTACATHLLFLCMLALLAMYKARQHASGEDVALFFVFIVQLQKHIQSIADEVRKLDVALEQTGSFRALLRAAAARQRRQQRHDDNNSDVSIRHLDAASEYAVVFDSVTASYATHGKEDSPLLLEDVSFHIRKNTVTVIMGPSGGGKTTLVRLMAGLISPTRGVVASSTADAERAGGAVAVLEQAPALLPGTVRANLLVAKPKATEEQLARACALASCTDFVAALPEGLETCIENVDVTRFSGGQLQRLCLARVFLSDAPLVIFDEPTTGLDAAAAGTIMDGLTRLRDQGRTVVFVTHLEAHRSLADTLLVVRDGRVVVADPKKDDFIESE